MSANQWQVSGVESWDSLNMRSQPGMPGKVIGEIPFDATNIVATGEEQNVGKTVWKEIEWDDKQGWVSKTYLAAMPEETETSGSEPEPEPELAAGIVTPELPVSDVAKTENLMSDTVAEDAGQEKTESGKAVVSSVKSETVTHSADSTDVASDGMTDLEALSILARPANAATDPEEKQAVGVMPASLKIMKEE